MIHFNSAGSNRYFWLFSKLFFVLFFLVFFIYPLAIVFAQIPSLDILRIISSNSEPFYNSFLQAFFSTLAAFCIGFPAAYLVARKNFFARNFLRSLALVPFVFPSILVVLSFIIVFGNNGWINSGLSILGIQKMYLLYGFHGITLAHAFYNFPIIMLFVSNAWQNLDRNMSDAAKSLGASKLQIFTKITVPQLFPSIASSVLLVFIYCFSSFAIVLSFGGVQFSTMEVEIFREISRNANLSVSASLAFVQFLFLLLISLVFWFFSKKTVQKQAFEQRRGDLKFSGFGVLQYLFLALLFAFVILPLAGLVVFAFFDSGNFSLGAFEKIVNYPKGLVETTPLLSIFYSLVLASATGLISVVVALLASLKQTKINFISLLLGSSIAISIITLGFGYYLGFGPENLLVIAIGHSILAFPFAFRIISNSINSIDKESIDSARSLGANDSRVLSEIIIPRIRSSLVGSFAFSFAVSLGELGLVLLLYNGVYATMPVYIYRLLSTFDIKAAAAMGLLLVFVSFVCFYLVQKDSEKVFV